MKGKVFGSVLAVSALCALSGCGAIGNKSTSLSVIYSVTAILSALLLIGYCALVRKRQVWFLLLFSSVLVVNVGYLALALSSSLEAALWANRVSYFGSVLLPMAMLMILLESTGLRYEKWLPLALLVICGAVFLVAASPGYLEIYYKSVTMETVHGATVLRKEYGPWHSLYLFYLLAYFAAMIGLILRAALKHAMASGVHAAFLTGAVGVNIGVWLLEQLVRIEFEFLSVSYIISELFLLGLCLMVQEQERFQQKAAGSAVSAPAAEPLSAREGQRERFELGVLSLTRTERAIFQFYLEGKSTKEVLAALDIKENTLKYHNKNLYSKLGVSSRKELLEIHRQLSSSDPAADPSELPPV